MTKLISFVCSHSIQKGGLIYTVQLRMALPFTFDNNTEKYFEISHRCIKFSCERFESLIVISVYLKISTLFQGQSLLDWCPLYGVYTQVLDPEKVSLSPG